MTPTSHHNLRSGGGSQETNMTSLGTQTPAETLSITSPLPVVVPLVLTTLPPLPVSGLTAQDRADITYMIIEGIRENA